MSEVVEFVKRSSPSELLQVVDYLRAIKELHGMDLGFEDVQFFFFKQKLSAMLNLVGLHYCIAWLQVPVYTCFTTPSTVLLLVFYKLKLFLSLYNFMKPLFPFV